MWAFATAVREGPRGERGDQGPPGPEGAPGDEGTVTPEQLEASTTRLEQSFDRKLRAFERWYPLPDQGRLPVPSVSYPRPSGLVSP